MATYTIVADGVTIAGRIASPSEKVANAKAKHIAAIP